MHFYLLITNKFGDQLYVRNIRRAGHLIGLSILAKAKKFKTREAAEKALANIRRNYIAKRPGTFGTRLEIVER